MGGIGEERPLLVDSRLGGMVKKLIPHGRARTYPGGVLIHQAGEQIDEVSIIKSGRVQLTRRNAQGAPSVSIVLGAGEMYGFFTVLSNRTRSHNIETLETTEIVCLSRDFIWNAIDSNPEMRRGVITFLSHRLSQAYDDLEDIRELPLSKRLAKRLTMYADENGCIPLTQARLADDIGASRYGVGCALKEIQEHGFIELGYGFIRLLDAPGLRKYILPPHH